MTNISCTTNSSYLYR